MGRWVQSLGSDQVRFGKLAPLVGVSATSLRSWALAAGRVSQPESGKFLAVVVHPTGTPSSTPEGLVLRRPRGYQVSGLELEDLVTVLRKLE